MTELIYNISKEAASQLLWVSTRTIDRYLASGRLTSKRMGNKVMLAQDEVLILRKETDNIEINSVEVISSDDHNESSSYGVWVNNTNLALGAEQLGQIIDDRFGKFATMLENKDNLIEEKNAMIFGLQKKIGEMEVKIQSMVALPDHTNEKEQLVAQKKELQNRLENITKSLSKEELKNNIFIWLLIIVWIIISMLMFRNPATGSNSATTSDTPTSDVSNAVIEEVK